MQGEAGGKESRLGVGGVGEQLRLFGAGLGEDQLRQGAIDQGVDLGAGRIEGFGVGGVGLVELFAHAGSLGALAGEQVGEPCSGRGLAEMGVGGALALGESLQGIQQLLALACHHHCPALELGPGRGQGVGEVGGGLAWVLLEVGG